MLVLVFLAFSGQSFVGLISFSTFLFALLPCVHLSLFPDFFLKFAPVRPLPFFLGI